MLACLLFSKLWIVLHVTKLMVTASAIANSTSRATKRTQAELYRKLHWGAIAPLYQSTGGRDLEKNWPLYKHYTKWDLPSHYFPLLQQLSCQQMSKVMLRVFLQYIMERQETVKLRYSFPKLWNGFWVDFAEARQLAEEKKIIKEDEVGATNWAFKWSTTLRIAFQIVVVHRAPLI